MAYANFKNRQKIGIGFGSDLAYAILKNWQRFGIRIGIAKCDANSESENESENESEIENEDEVEYGNENKSDYVKKKILYRNC